MPRRYTRLAVPYRVRIIEVEVPTLRHVNSLRRTFSLEQVVQGEKLSGIPSPEQIRHFLIALRDAGPAGLPSASIVQIFGVAKATALGGSISKTTRQLLNRLGFDASKVYVNRRKRGSKHWWAGPRIEDAIAAIETMISEAAAADAAA